jgi:hypothetical protein
MKSTVTPRASVSSHLLVQRLQAVARDAQEVIDALSVLAHLLARQDHRLLHARGVQAVLVHAARPRDADDLVVRHRTRGLDADVGHVHHGGDVFALG